MKGWDDFGHVGYMLFLDLYRAVPWADQGWSYFHPPLHYSIGWGLAVFSGGLLAMIIAVPLWVLVTFLWAYFSEKGRKVRFYFFTFVVFLYTTLFNTAWCSVVLWFFG